MIHPRGRGPDMTFIIEFDGPIVELGPVYYQVYRDVAAEVGWSRLDQASYWRQIRTRGREAVVLPSAKPSKVKEFWTRFDQRIEEDPVVATYELLPGIEAVLEKITRHGRCRVFTLGSNLGERQLLIERIPLALKHARIERLHEDPRRRSGELRALAGGDRRVLVVAGSDAVARSAGQAELLTVGISSGSCNATRLRRAGADIVYKGLHELAETLQSGAKDLIQAGLPPLSLD